MNLNDFINAETGRIIYIAGTGRNGSTLVGQCLASHPSFLFPGELTHVWRRGLVDDELCGCGRKFKECDFWKQVTDRSTFPSSGSIEQVTQFRDQASRFSRIPTFLAGQKADRTYDRSYVEAYGWLIGRLRNVGRAPWIVDASKYPTDLAVLIEHRKLLPPIHVLHLVRDCNATVYAWKKKKVRKEIHWKTQYMPRYSAIQTTVAWHAFNRLTKALVTRHEIPYSFVRYEDFAVDPMRVLSRLFAEFGMSDLDSQVAIIKSSADRREPERSHVIGGNPSKFKFDVGAIHVDDEWKTKMSRFDRILVKCIAGRMQREYGYGQ